MLFVRQVGSARVVTLPADPQSNKAERQLQVRLTSTPTPNVTCMILSAWLRGIHVSELDSASKDRTCADSFQLPS